VKFSIVTPSFNQLDWLRVCIASVRDQVVSIPSPLESELPFLSIEHIVQDAGTSGIEAFAREQGAAFYRDGEKIFGCFGDTSDTAECHNNSQKVKYFLSIYAEKDSGMYDAINRGLARAQGDLCAYLNCDEQYLEGVLPCVADWFKKNSKLFVFHNFHYKSLSYGKKVCSQSEYFLMHYYTEIYGRK
jgi:glycosyltransferase involved in cell wall biosynthesis